MKADIWHQLLDHMGEHRMPDFSSSLKRSIAAAWA
jgi:hypothetical protein